MWGFLNFLGLGSGYFLWVKVFGFCSAFGVESFWIGLKVLGFGGGFLVWGFEFLLRVWG